MNTDRRDIAPSLLAWFPSMEQATSDEWHFFLDKLTALETPLSTTNGEAFDRWRKVLHQQGYPVFPYSPAALDAIRAKAHALLEAEQARAASIGKTLSDLAREAPNWPASEVLASTKGKP